MVTEPAYLETAHNSVWTAIGYQDRPLKKDWSKREISHAHRFLDRAVYSLNCGLVGVVYRLSRLAHYHSHRGMHYCKLESMQSGVDEDLACELWEEAITLAKKADLEFLHQFPVNPAPRQWNQHRDEEKRLYHNWEFQMEVGPVDERSEGREPWASDSDSWKPDGWQLSPNSEYNED